MSVPAAIVEVIVRLAPLGTVGSMRARSPRSGPSVDTRQGKLLSTAQNRVPRLGCHESEGGVEPPALRCSKSSRAFALLAVAMSFSMSGPRRGDSKRTGAVSRNQSAIPASPEEGPTPPWDRVQCTHPRRYRR